MGFIGSALGSLTGGLLGSDQASVGQGVSNPVSPEQLKQNQQQQALANQQQQQSLQQQQAFAQAVAAQGGLQNQSNVYNQFQNMASGQGPNPAQAMLANTTGQNTANQAALMASQRGAGANPALLARMAAMQGGANQQQAAGQAAALQAQQSQQALGQMANIAGQQVQNQAGAVQNYGQQALSGQSNANAALGNTMSAQNQANQNQIAINQADQKNQQQGAGNLLSGISTIAGGPIGGAIAGAAKSLLPSIGFADGGEVPDSSEVLNDIFSADFDPMHEDNAQMNSGGDVNGPKSYVAQHFLAKGGKVKAMLSPGEKYLKPEEAKAVAQGNKSIKEAGVKVPGQAKVKGDSLKNDVVPANLEEGGFVIPRSVMNSKDPEKSAAAFVRAHMTKENLKKGKK